jgi:SARP family transcriptional regulator, regulator of embCAB operon
MDNQTVLDGPIRFEILGPLRALRGARELDLGPSKQRAVLALLLLNANKPTSIAQIVDAVWGDEPPENGPNVVQKYVGGLRRVMEPDRSPRAPGQLISRTDAGYRISVVPEQLDVEIFRGMVRDAHAARSDGDPATATHLLAQATEAWRGEPLAGLTGPAFDAARSRLEEDRAAALETWAELRVSSGEPAQLVPVLLHLVAEYPLREQLRYLLIVNLYRSGRQAEALAAYREARQFLAEEFGVEPGERLQDLHRRMLRADPTLLTAATPRADPTPPTATAPRADPTPPTATTPPPIPPQRGGPLPPRPSTAGQPTPPPPMILPPYPTVAGPTPPPPAWLVGPPTRPSVWRPARRRRWWQVLVGVVAVLIPLASFGMATWAVIGAYAAVRRSIRHGLAALGYLALLLGIFQSTYTGTREDLRVLATFFAALSGSVYAGLLAFSRRWGGTDRLIRQETARAIFQHSPAIARQLNIGRPDLPAVFDDGGLLDINTVPDWAIATLRGISPADAAGIVRARHAYGVLRSLDHLMTAGHFSRATLAALRENAVFFPAPVPPPPVDSHAFVPATIA